MALLAENAADRAEQLIAMTERLIALLEEETGLIEARQPPLSGESGAEKARLANLYRQEMLRIAEDRALIRTAPAQILDRLRGVTVRFRAALSAHELALRAVKEVSEGLVKAIAEEVAKVRAGPRAYGAGGAYAQGAPGAVALDRTA